MIPIIFFVAAFILAIGAIVFSRMEQKKKLRSLIGMKLLLVRFPRVSPDGKDVMDEINFSEQFFSGLVSLKEPVVFEVAVPYIGEEIHFYASLSERHVPALVRHIQSIWKDAQVEVCDDYNIFNHSGVVSGAFLSQKKSFAYPVRTYRELGADTFSSIVGGLAKINEMGEGGAIQFILVPAGKDEKKKISSMIRTLKKGEPLETPTFNPLGTVGYVHDAIMEGTGKGSAKDSDKEKMVDESAVKALESKIEKPLFKVNVRIIASAPSQTVADSIVDGIVIGFSQLNSSEKNEFSVVQPKSLREFVHEFSFRSFNESQRIVLNTEEIASIFHFPTPFTSAPKIKELHFKEVPPPSILPKDGVKIGESRYRGMVRDVRILKDDRRRHMYIVGQTGTGKSVFLNNLSAQDMQNKEGLCLIDPNGDVFEDVLARVPKERARDVIIFDPSDLQHPFGLNMLEYDGRFPEQKTFIINELMGIFDTLYDLKTTGGPMFEQYTRNALLLLMDDPNAGYTILEIPRVLSDAVFRKKLLDRCLNIIAKDFWEKEAEKAGGEAALANLVPYITSKFNTFIANDYVRPIIAQSKSTLRFRDIMDEGKILLVNLSKGRIGEINASLLGMILIGKITMAAFSRTDIPMEKRKDFYMYIDEFQNFTTPGIATILSEARKYRLCLTVAHQFISQLSENIRNAVFGNVGSIVAFRVGADDAEYLEKQFDPVFQKSNLINIDNLNAHVKLLINSQVSPPFNIVVPLPERSASPSDIEALRDASRASYGRPRDVVEREIYERLRGIEKEKKEDENG
jgi:hypothetical protein